MSSLSDVGLREHAECAKDKVVIITGGAMGLGKRAGGEFIRAGAKVVIGDLNLKVAEETVAEFKELGGEAIAIRTDVTKWDDQVALFSLAVSTFGHVDIVIANAGVGEVGKFDNFPDVKKKEPAKPNFITGNVNLVGVLYTSRLAMFHFQKNPGPRKSLVLLGSVASIMGLPMGPMYGQSKHGVAGIMRSLSTTAPSDTSISMVCPWFADTTILEKDIRLVLRGLPWTSIPRVGAAIFHASTDPSRERSNGAAYIVPDAGEVFRVGRDTFDLISPEFYDVMRKRINDEASDPVGPAAALEWS